MRWIATLNVARQPIAEDPSWHPARLVLAGLGTRQRRLLCSAARDSEVRVFASPSASRVAAFLRAARHEYARACAIEWRQLVPMLEPRAALKDPKPPSTGWHRALLGGVAQGHALTGNDFAVHSTIESIDCDDAVAHRWRWVLTRASADGDSPPLAEFRVDVSVTQTGAVLAGGDSALVAGVSEPVAPETKALDTP